MKNFRVEVTGVLREGVCKDMALAVIGEVGTAGGTGYAIEFWELPLRHPMEGRMTLYNMAIEAGARCGLVALTMSLWNTFITNRCSERRGLGPGGGMVAHPPSDEGRSIEL